MSSLKKNKINTGDKKEIKILLVQAEEDRKSFQDRKDSVQVLLSDLIFRLHKRGRPSNRDLELNHAA